MKIPEFEMHYFNNFLTGILLKCIYTSCQTTQSISKMQSLLWCISYYEYVLLYWEVDRGYWKGWTYSISWDCSNFLLGDSLVSFSVSCQFSECQPNSFSPPAFNLSLKKKWRHQRKTDIQTFKLVTLFSNTILSQYAMA